jgi:hypothetical protein
MRFGKMSQTAITRIPNRAGRTTTERSSLGVLKFHSNEVTGF